ncbi:glycosyl hydrolase [uncultured Draconibacterium sp.]|uniref:glycosyl hydrolase n=1 Tax=uncultured Draconibacterium sp. TaxID=1573823 RepID=UPI00325FFC5E
MLKQSNFKLISIILLMALVICCTNRPDSQKEKNLDNICYNLFINPPNDYRTHTFYSINDSLTEKEIQRQIIDFKQAGLGGFYLHSRSGLITEFLGDDWWKIMKASVEAANQAGLNCMFYDEDKWPSGFAGGIVPRMDENFRAKCLARLEKNTPLPEGAQIIAEDEKTNYVLYTSQFGYDIFNGTCYVDLFNPEAVQAFIDVSYRPYVDKYKTAITTYTPAIFSDEPHVHARYFDKNTPNLGTLSYSPWLEKKFSEMHGYKLRDKLPLLYEEKDNWREVRMHYYQAKALAFEESYTKQLADYCGKNGFDYTGHYLAEDILYKVRDRAANTMLHYRSMQQPGMDMLGLSITNKLITARNLSSVANQYGKQKRLSELFGISGQNMNFEDRKWLAGWHSILGVNHFCPHLTLYSMKGHRKRDYPPTFSYQQPYWNYNKKIEDYLGRIAYAASIGKYVPQLLVISPLESEYIKGNNDGEFTSGMLEALDVLQALHYDYDVGDEQIMADTAFVQANKLVIGAMQYGHIVLPDMISIRETTLKLIETLQKNGGLVINFGRFPVYVDGKKDEDRLAMLKKSTLFLSAAEAPKLLPEKIKPNVTLKGVNTDKIWTQTRKVQNGQLINFYNSSRTQSIQFDLVADFNNVPLLWDPSEIECYTLEKNKDGSYSIELSPSSSIWITTGEINNTIPISGDYKLPELRKNVFVFENEWQGERKHANAITLDFAQYSTNGDKTMSTPEPVIGIFNRLASQNYIGQLVLNYPLHVKTLPQTCQLVLEQPDMYSSVSINGTEIVFNTNQYYIDRTFKSTDISALISAGDNNIQLKLDFKAPQPLSSDPVERYGTEIESIYLTGDFAVEGKNELTTNNTQRNRTGDFQERPAHQFSAFSITAEKDIFSGNLTTEGYPFYAGSFSLSQDFEMAPPAPGNEYYLELPNCEAIVAVVEINGQVVDTLVWAPFRTEISNYLYEGKNKLNITLINSLRNLLGPHHHKGVELIKVGPRSFTGSGGFPDGRGEKDWYDLRKKEIETAIWTDTYNHIPFGFIENVKITSSK